MKGDKIQIPDEVTDILDELEQTVEKAAELAQALPERIDPYEYNRLVATLTGSEGPYIGSGVPDYIKGYRETLAEKQNEDNEELDCPSCKRIATVDAWEAKDGRCPFCDVQRD